MPTSPILGITQVSSSQAGKETTINDAIDALEKASNARLAVSFAGGSSVLLSNTQAQRNFMFEATAATANCILRFPNTINAVNYNRVFVVRNNSGFQLTVKFNTGVGSTVIIPNGETRLIAAVNALDMIVAAQAGTAVTFLALTQTPDSFAGQSGKMLVVNVAEDSLEFVAAATFPSYVANAGKVLAVNGTATGVEWITVTSSFLGLSQTPDSFAGQGGKLVAVNAGATALEFIDAPDAAAVTFVESTRWRVFVLTKGADAQCGFGEVEFLDQDGIDLTGTGTASASNFQAGFEPAQAFNNSVVAGTGWLTQAAFAGAIWLEYDFGTDVTIRNVRCTPVTGAPQYSPTQIKIQYYDVSLADWVDAGTRTTAAWVSGSAQTFKVNGVPIASGIAVAIEEDGVQEHAAIERINFTGNGVDVVVIGDEATVTITSLEVAIEDEGVEESAAIQRINFVGSGVDVAVAAGEATVTINGTTQGTAFPFAPAAGDKFFRTDRGIEYYFDGTNWLSTQLFTLTVNGAANATSDLTGYQAVPWFGTYALWLVRIDASIYISTTGEWDVNLNYISAANVTTQIANVDGSAQTGNTWVARSANINAALSNNARALSLIYDEVSGSAAMYGSGILSYRLIG